jgi:hypothetical protein
MWYNAIMNKLPSLTVELEDKLIKEYKPKYNYDYIVSYRKPVYRPRKEKARRLSANPIAGFKIKRASCHPDKPLFSRGLCSICYSKFYSSKKFYRLNSLPKHIPEIEKGQTSNGSLTS